MSRLFTWRSVHTRNRVDITSHTMNNVISALVFFPLPLAKRCRKDLQRVQTLRRLNAAAGFTTLFVYVCGEVCEQYCFLIKVERTVWLVQSLMHLTLTTTRE